MVYLYLSIILFLFSLTSLSAQQADYSSIKNIIEARFWVDLDTVDMCEAMIVLNGVPFDSVSINEELTKYQGNEMISTTLVDLSELPVCNTCTMILLVTEFEPHKRSHKIRLLDSIRNNLNQYVPELKIKDYSCGKCKQVIINNQLYGIYEARRIVNELKVKDIKYIYIYESSDPAIYGSNARNGLVEIFLNDNKKWTNSSSK